MYIYTKLNICIYTYSYNVKYIYIYTYTKLNSHYIKNENKFFAKNRRAFGRICFLSNIFYCSIRAAIYLYMLQSQLCMYCIVA